jgi:hypothetical protein
MVGPQQDRRAGPDVEHDPVTEARPRTRQRDAADLVGLEHLVERETSERDDDAEITEQVELLEQVRPAVVDLRRQRLVLRRSASHRRADREAAQLQAVVRVHRRRLIGEPGLEERAHQEAAGAHRVGAVAGEHASGAVGSVRRGRQADDHDARERIAETRYRSRPVLVVDVRAFAHAPHLFAIGHEPRTARAAHDAGVEGVDRILRCGPAHRYIAAECFHLMPQPMLAVCSGSTSRPSRTASSAARRSRPVTGVSFAGRESSNCPW